MTPHAVGVGAFLFGLFTQLQLSDVVQLVDPPHRLLLRSHRWVGKRGDLPPSLHAMRLFSGRGQEDESLEKRAHDAKRE